MEQDPKTANPTPPEPKEGGLAEPTPLKFSSSFELLLFLSRLPMNRNVEETSLSPFLRRFRRNAHVHIDDLAKALNLTQESILKFESSQTLPWELETSVMVKLANAYRIHVEAIDFLTYNTYQIAKLSKTLKDPDQARSSMLKWLADVKLEMQAVASLDLTT